MAENRFLFLINDSLISDYNQLVQKFSTSMNKNEDFDKLMEMGFSREQVEEAFFVSKNIDEALAYLFQKQEESQQPSQPQPQSQPSQPSTLDNLTSTLSNILSNFSMQEYKMILVVREDLKMGKGKIGAQCGHAVLGAYRQVLNGNNQIHKEWLNNWEIIGEAKICLKCNSEKEMVDLAAVAKEKGLNAYVVVDAGRTQIASGSKTVLAIGPAPVDVVNPVTSHLRLL
jgi:PTH2 family peptidyl-tRNA hydrolase